MQVKELLVAIDKLNSQYASTCSKIMTGFTNKRWQSAEVQEKCRD